MITVTIKTNFLRCRRVTNKAGITGSLLRYASVFLIAFIFMTQPDYYTSKTSDPIFWPVAMGVFASYLAGLYMIRRIINFRY